MIINYLIRNLKLDYNITSLNIRLPSYFCPENKLITAYQQVYTDPHGSYINNNQGYIIYFIIYIFLIFLIFVF